MAAVHTKGRDYISHRTQERDQDRWDFSTLVNTQVGQIPLLGALLSSLVTSDRISFILGHFERFLLLTHRNIARALKVVSSE